ncbi:MAG: response regulator transcription factor [Eubacteriaceae bacterium]|nr:response regulator transcription factor [Eubacteriaceae bacterium]
MIWCVEDDSDIREIEMYALNSAGLETRGFEDGISFMEALKKETPDLVILDIMLPGMDGIEILRKMKESVLYSRIPVILATAKGQEYDRIHGLDLGADDYIVKPFSVMEMVLRVKAVLRRSQPQQVSRLLKAGGLIVNLDEHTVVADTIRVQLTYKEFELLRMFLSHPGMVFTREQLFSQVWDTDYMGDSRTLDSHIRTLRQKIGEYGKMIETVRNVGYRWEADYDK